MDRALPGRAPRRRARTGAGDRREHVHAVVRRRRRDAVGRPVRHRGPPRRHRRRQPGHRRGDPEAAFDCFLCTQTLHVIDDVAAAVRGIHDTLAPGGVALVTMPGVSQTSREDARDWGDWWRFTTASATRLFADAFGAGKVEVTAHGNVMTACAFLYGLSAEELTAEGARVRRPGVRGADHRAGRARTGLTPRPSPSPSPSEPLDIRPAERVECPEVPGSWLAADPPGPEGRDVRPEIGEQAGPHARRAKQLRLAPAAQPHRAERVGLGVHAVDQAQQPVGRAELQEVDPRLDAVGGAQRLAEHEVAGRQVQADPVLERRVRLAVQVDRHVGTPELLQQPVPEQPGGDVQDVVVVLGVDQVALAVRGGVADERDPRPRRRRGGSGVEHAVADRQRQRAPDVHADLRGGRRAQGIERHHPVKLRHVRPRQLLQPHEQVGVRPGRADVAGQRLGGEAERQRVEVRERAGRDDLRAEDHDHVGRQLAQGAQHRLGVAARPVVDEGRRDAGRRRGHRAAGEVGLLPDEGDPQGVAHDGGGPAEPFRRGLTRRATGAVSLRTRARRGDCHVWSSLAPVR